MKNMATVSNNNNNNNINNRSMIKMREENVLQCKSINESLFFFFLFVHEKNLSLNVKVTISLFFSSSFFLSFCELFNVNQVNGWRKKLADREQKADYLLLSLLLFINPKR